MTGPAQPAGRVWADDELSVLLGLAFDAGRYRERERIAEGYAELDACWRPVGQRMHEQRVAERLAEMEQAARRVAAEMGRPAGWTYRGGPVDYTTGQPRAGRRMERTAA